MNELLAALSWLLLAGGLLFFAAGSIGLLRFPDTLSRLHALTKADTLGFGLVVAGLALRAGSLLEVAQMLLIWLLVLASGATACQLLARQREDQGADGERDDG
ncbi:cation:proton antiporter [Stutzerimonas stutzeri]|uniref:cation:proton antiporter n=1 Tax=Stutzerimonas stutzeri TaxID=316 RepID=UPI00066E61AF|nr:monovalent cation/H(+) antiporter subunit G [Stutzerimonas stutzeri]